MKANFISNLFNSKGKKDTAETEQTKYFAVVYTGQGRTQVRVENTHENITAFVREYCKSPSELEAMGTCDKNGIVEMTNPDKFDRGWLDMMVKQHFRPTKGLFPLHPADAAKDKS